MHLTDQHTTFQRLRTYIASSLFLASNGWQRDGVGNILVYKIHNSPCDIVMVGIVQDNRAYLTPDGNWSPKFNTNFSTTKFTFSLGRPDNTVFAADFDIAVTRLQTIQGAIASTTDRRYLLDTKNNFTTIRLSAPVFEERDASPTNTALVPVGETVTTLVQSSAPIIDSLTAYWPVTSEHVPLLNAIKSTHTALQLPVFGTDDVLIHPLAVKPRLVGALVEVTFSLKQFLIKRDDITSFDSFSATIQQIVIMQDPKPKAANRANMKQGPKRPSSMSYENAGDAKKAKVFGLGSLSTTSPELGAALVLPAQEAAQAPVTLLVPINDTIPLTEPLPPITVPTPTSIVIEPASLIPVVPADLPDALTSVQTVGRLTRKKNTTV